MAGIPQFSPEGSPSEVANVIAQAGTAASNWMTQAQERQLRAAQEQRQQQQFATLLPALVAKANADTLAAQSDAQSAMLQQQLRGQWQTMKPQVVADLAAVNDPSNVKLQPDGTPDWNAQYQQLETMQAKYAGLAMLPEGKAYYGMIEEAKKNAFDMAMKHNLAQLALDRTQAMLEGRLQQMYVQGQNQANVANINAGARTQTAQTSADSRVQAATIAGQSRVTAAQAHANRTYEFEKLKDLHDQAVASGDTEGAALYSARMAKLNHISVSSGEALQQMMNPAAAPNSSAGSTLTPAQAPVSKLPTIKTQADYDALPPGSDFLAPNGQRRHKP